MDTSISDKLLPKNIKKKPKRKSPLSETYKKFLKQEDIKLSPTKKSKSTKLEDIKINVIKSPEIHKEKKPCKRKRVRINKNGNPNKEDIFHNKKCEKDQKDQIDSPKKIKKLKSKKKSRKKKSLHKKKSLRKKNFSKQNSNVKKSFKNELEKSKQLSEDSMKKELLKEGIEIKGNHKKILRDIYAFSKLGGIKIHKE